MTDNATAGGRIRRLPRLIIRESVRLLRHNWRRLTSMSTALVLLFLLALAALPGAMLPQRNLNVQKVSQYIAAQPTLGPLFDKLELFDVFSSFWFTAIYVLLFLSHRLSCSTPAGASRRASEPTCTSTSESVQVAAPFPRRS